MVSGVTSGLHPVVDRHDGVVAFDGGQPVVDRVLAPAAAGDHVDTFVQTGRRDDGFPAEGDIGRRNNEDDAVDPVAGADGLQRAGQNRHPRQQEVLFGLRAFQAGPLSPRHNQGIDHDPFHFRYFRPLGRGMPLPIMSSP